jgi:ubiquitin carboxyl-terminal hydrolase 36/42
VGLTNCGNTCFANATLQCLFTVGPFLRYFLKHGHQASCHLHASGTWCFLCAVEEVIRSQQSSKQPVNPGVRSLRLCSSAVLWHRPLYRL